MSANDSRLDKIRALLAKAEDPAATPAEAEAYTAKASELISKWGLEDAIAEAAEADRPYVTDKIVRMEGTYQTAKQTLLYRVAKGLGVKSVALSKKSATGNRQVHLFGTPNDIVRVELLFTSLLVQAAQGVTTAAPVYHWEGIKSYRRSWLIGFTQAVGDRLDAQRRKDTAEAGAGTDLVLFDRSSLINQKVAEFYPKLVTRRVATSSRSGDSAGRSAGNRARLGTGGGVTNNSGSRALSSR